MEAALVEIVRSLYRSWLYDSYFSLYRPIHPGKSPGEMSGEKCPDTMKNYITLQSARPFDY